ncbi:hypothetical protein BB561_005295 [Smittium simulii]|uniref:Rab-GAP TBC domain-containing protein n=1 Tax=Smittium simulii TaxID=133385 RepID=A0A2T9YB58_9FUNG|nr:hypothetical protein BB561_005295 [Smittium simulii]
MNNNDAQTILDASDFFQENSNDYKAVQKLSAGSVQSYQNSTATETTPPLNSDKPEFSASQLQNISPVPIENTNNANSPNNNLIDGIINRRNSNLYTIEKLSQLNLNSFETSVPSLEKSIKNAVLVAKYLENFEKNVDYQTSMINLRSKSSKKTSVSKSNERKTSKNVPQSNATSDLSGNANNPESEKILAANKELDSSSKKKSLLEVDKNPQDSAIDSIVSSYDSPNTQSQKYHFRSNRNPNRISTLYQDINPSSKTTKIFANALLKAGFSSIAIGVAQSSAKPGLNDGLVDMENNFYQKTSVTSLDFDTISANSANNLDNVERLGSLDLSSLQILDEQVASTKQLAVTEIRAKRLQYIEYIDAFGFLSFNSLDPNKSNKIEAVSSSNAPTTLPKDSKKDIDEWGLILSSFSSYDIKKSQKFQTLAKNGLPNVMRPQIYWHLLNIQSVYGEILNGTGFIDEYNNFCDAECDSVLQEVIERDLPRSFPNHAYFYDESCQGIQKLRRILRAYVRYNPEVGYCQGMNQVAGVLLILGMPEVETFWSLAALLDTYMLDYFTPTLAQLRVHAAVFDLLLFDHNKKLATHLQEGGCESLMYVTPWFMTVFTMSLPWESALRVWDWFIFRGTKILFRVALGIMDICSKELLTNCKTIDKQLGILLHLPDDWVTPEKLVAAANKIKLTTNQIERKTDIVIKRLSSQMN